MELGTVDALLVLIESGADCPASDIVARLQSAFKAQGAPVLPPTHALAAAAAEDCAICMDSRPEVAVRPCGHALCFLCACKLCSAPLEPACPFCRGEISKFLQLDEPGGEPARGSPQILQRSPKLRHESPVGFVPAPKPWHYRAFFDVGL